MGVRNKPLIDFSKSNIKLVTKSILKNLSPDLLPKKWHSLNKSNPTFGHCHTASGVFYAIFASENVHLYKAFDDSFKLVDEPMFHWFILNRHTHEIIDITASQYSSHPKLLSNLYKNRQKASPLGFGYKIRVHDLLDRVKKDLLI
jgi:hypothetical protein